MGINSSPRTWVTGETVTAAEMNAEVRDVAVGIQAAWTTFTPTLTAATTNPTGTTYTGSAYLQIGKTVHFRAVITLAATTGTGSYSIALPVTPKASTEQTVRGLITDNGTGWLSVTIRTAGSATSPLLCDPTTAGTTLRAVTPTVPITFAAGDIINIEGTYEAA